MEPSPQLGNSSNPPAFRHVYDSSDDQDNVKDQLSLDRKPDIVQKANIHSNTTIFRAYECAECKRKFNTTHLLDLHLEEAHSPFFQVAAERHDTQLYKCLLSSCLLRFDTPKDRKLHWREQHSITGKPEPPFYLHNRKRKKRQAKPSAMQTDE